MGDMDYIKFIVTENEKENPNSMSRQVKMRCDDKEQEEYEIQNIRPGAF